MSLTQNQEPIITEETTIHRSLEMLISGPEENMFGRKSFGSVIRAGVFRGAEKG